MDYADDRLRTEFLEAAATLLQKGDVISERLMAATVIGNLGDERYIPMLLNVLRQDPNRQIQHKVSQAIARIGGIQAETGLQDLMSVENQYTRFVAAEALADIVSRGST